MRHVDVRFLWLQQAVLDGKLRILSVPTAENISDVFTNALTREDAERCCEGMRYKVGQVGSSRHRRLTGGD